MTREPARFGSADERSEGALRGRKYCKRSKRPAKDWRAHAEWLRLSFPADYRGSANKIEVNATASASSFVVTVEKQRELQERRRAALESLHIPGES
jgi:hypothetical protein